MERSVYRIIDANFNRAREAIRVMEEFCRFSLNSSVLAERAKQLRHKLSGAIGKLDAGKLLSSRDTRGDVGVGPPPGAHSFSGSDGSSSGIRSRFCVYGYSILDIPRERC